MVLNRSARNSGSWEANTPKLQVLPVGCRYHFSSDAGNLSHQPDFSRPGLHLHTAATMNSMCAVSRRLLCIFIKTRDQCWDQMPRVGCSPSGRHSLRRRGGSSCGEGFLRMGLGIEREADCDPDVK